MAMRVLRAIGVIFAPPCGHGARGVRKFMKPDREIV